MFVKAKYFLISKKIKNKKQIFSKEEKNGVKKKIIYINKKLTSNQKLELLHAQRA
jgi:hypothetical protein